MTRSVRKTFSRALRDSEAGWRYAFNLASSASYALHKDPLSPEGERILRQINRDGIGLTSIESLGLDELGLELESTVARMEAEAGAKLAVLRQAADDTSTIGTKTFLHQLLGSRPRLDAESVFARFVLAQPILSVVNAYFGMYTRLREYNVWRTFVTSVPARESQLWHRDREDRLILKVFVYLDDVDEGAGPFTYAPGTHKKGSIQTAPEAFDEKGVRRSTDEQMAKIVPAGQWIQAAGKKGTVIFADTHGYHKGGHARTRERLMYTSLFTSPSSQSMELMERPARALAFPDQARTVALGPASRKFCLSLPRPERS
jgi:ectoine hydroxylase-related dioxygenase (phytanoyl-CoA dioxygenase family)